MEIPINVICIPLPIFEVSCIYKTTFTITFLCEGVVVLNISYHRDMNPCMVVALFCACCTTETRIHEWFVVLFLY